MTPGFDDKNGWPGKWWRWRWRWWWWWYTCMTCWSDPRPGFVPTNLKWRSIASLVGIICSSAQPSWNIWFNFILDAPTQSMPPYLVLVPPKQPDSQCLGGKVIQAQYCGEKLTKFIFGTLWFEVKWKQNERKKTIKEQLPIYCLSDPNDFPCQRKISYNFPLVPKTPSTPSPPIFVSSYRFPPFLCPGGQIAVMELLSCSQPISNSTFSSDLVANNLPDSLSMLPQFLELVKVKYEIPF